MRISRVPFPSLKTLVSNDVLTLSLSYTCCHPQDKEKSVNHEDGKQLDNGKDNGTPV